MHEILLKYLMNNTQKSVLSIFGSLIFGSFWKKLSVNITIFYKNFPYIVKWLFSVSDYE